MSSSLESHNYAPGREVPRLTSGDDDFRSKFVSWNLVLTIVAIRMIAFCILVFA